jgi:pyruvate kinase
MNNGNNLPGFPLTKIVATYGPACFKEEVMMNMVNSGVTCFRLNTAHSTTDELISLVKFRDKISKENQKYISIMVDLKGPELRALVKGDKITLEEGGQYTLGELNTNSDIELKIDNVVNTLDEGDRILFMDGKILTSVLSKGDKQCKIKAENSGEIKKNGRMNIPGKYIPMGILQERDKEYLKLSVENNVEYVALSFVQNRKEIDMVHDMIIDMGGNIKIIAKIETMQALVNLDGIIHASDALMVARGDLGVEMPLNEVTVSQKSILKKAHGLGLPTIVATQMLESMVENESPTRAEISDITNAILDDTDALMLSEESAIGKFPVEAVRVLRDTSLYVEKYYNEFPDPEDFNGSRITYSVSRSAKVLAEQIESHHIVVLTRGGNTARMVSSVRPKTGIIAVTTSREVAGIINLYRGVSPIVLESFREDIKIKEVINYLLSRKKIASGERIVIVSGHPDHLFAGTAQVSVITAGMLLARGYVVGTSISGFIDKGNRKYNIFMGESKLVESTDAFLSSFDGFILMGSVKRSLLQKMIEMGKTCIYSTIVLEDIKEGEKVFIDSEIGSIYR